MIELPERLYWKWLRPDTLCLMNRPQTGWENYTIVASTTISPAVDNDTLINMARQLLKDYLEEEAYQKSREEFVKHEL